MNVELITDARLLRKREADLSVWDLQCSSCQTCICIIFTIII